MSGNWRISTFNGALLAAYFIPAWTIAAFNIIVSPIHGLYERPNISLALFVSDHLQLAGIATVRVALLLALGRITVVAFLAAFLVFVARASTRRSGACNEALGMALAIGSVMSFAGVLMASQAGETSALRLHAAELLMMLGTVIVMLIERPAPPRAGAAPAALSLADLARRPTTSECRSLRRLASQSAAAVPITRIENVAVANQMPDSGRLDWPFWQNQRH